MTQTLRFIIQYDGVGFIGWQRNPQGLSVQQAIEEAVATYLRAERMPIQAAGRTDTGVHAWAQAASMRLTKPWRTSFDPTQAADLERLLRSVNGLLPPRAAVLQAALMPDGFDARRHAAGKTYRYLISTASMRLPLWRNRCWELFIPRGLDLDLMREAAAIIPGRHDFAAFQGRGGDVLTTVRTMHAVDIASSGPLTRIDVRGEGFLKHMVRVVAGTLVEVGLHKRTVESVRALLDGGTRSQAGETAPAQGLTLLSVAYPPPWDRPVQVAGLEVIPEPDPHMKW